MEKAERKSNFDLMRVLCILLIIMYHYTTHAGYLYGNTTPMKYFYEATGIWGLTGVLGFVMVSSHFLYSHGSFSIQKVLRVVFETSFYSTTITLILFLTGSATLGIYLIHENGYFHYILFDNILRRAQVYNMTLGPLIYLVSCIGVLLGCALIHCGVEFVFKKTVYMLSDKYLKKHYKAFDVKFVPGQEKKD